MECRVTPEDWKPGENLGNYKKYFHWQETTLEQKLDSDS